MSTSLVHFYHVYADGQYEPCIEEHIAAMKESGLLDALDKFYIGIVGTVPNRRAVVRFFNERGVYPEVVAQAEDGYEQLTLKKLRLYANRHFCKLFYAHTKGAANPSPLHDAWRASMVYFNIIKWEKQVEMLRKADVAGCHWITKELFPDAPTVKPNSRFFGGTYWWANSKYITTLGPLDESSRWPAEDWIGENPKVRAYDANPGWPNMGIFVTEW